LFIGASELHRRGFRSALRVKSFASSTRYQLVLYETFTIRRREHFIDSTNGSLLSQSISSFVGVIGREGAAPGAIATMTQTEHLRADKIIAAAGQEARLRPAINP
jgi:hypothetical protein